MPGHAELVTVFQTGNPALIAVARSILDGTKIEYQVKGEGLQNLFGMGQIGTGYNLMVGPVEIQVRPEDESSARQLLAELHEGNSATS